MMENTTGKSTDPSTECEHAAPAEATLSGTMRATTVPEVPNSLQLAAQLLRKAHPSPALRELREAAWSTFESMGIPANGHEDFSFVSAADLKSVLTRMPPAEEMASVDVTSTTKISVQSPSTATASNATGLKPQWVEFLMQETDAPATLAAALAPEPLDIVLGDLDAVNLKLSGFKSVDGIESRADYAVLIDVSAHARASVNLAIENPDAAAFVNAVVYLHLGTGARLDLTLSEAAVGFQLVKIGAEVRKDAQFNLLSVSTGSRLARLSIETSLREPGAALDVRGAAVLNGTNRSHRHLRIRHAAPDCASKQLFKTVVDGAGRSSMDGTVFVDRGAQRTDARQLLQHLLVSKDGRADAKPRLLIHADDVKCSHGATVGKTDPAQKFYLLSRGLDSQAADRLLTQAFIGEALDIFPAEQTEAARQRLMAAIGARTKDSRG